MFTANSGKNTEKYKETIKITSKNNHSHTRKTTVNIRYATPSSFRAVST